VSEVKKRRITKADWGKVEAYIAEELHNRQNNRYRKMHEAIWKEVDRQVAMQSMKRIVDGREVIDWHSTVELGELAKASEVITADVRRMVFPHSRAWFRPHVDIGEAGADQQQLADGVLRAFMAQQHHDFGLKARFELSVKEALHHGSFVAEIIPANRQKVYEGTKLERVAAPVWQPHSMWNCYPDPSPSVIGTDMFYEGSMMICKSMPRHKVEAMAVGEGWMHIAQIPKKGKGDEVELVYYYGDLFIERHDGDIFLPNCKAITANKKIIYYAPNDTPFVPIVFGGYERLDIRDPYYTSPIVKLSPMQKLASVMANKFIEGVALKTEPPIVYDGSDAYFVQSDGPVIAPGAKSPTKGTNNWAQVDIGDPSWAANGLEMAIRQIQEGTGVNAIRAGVMASDRQTATEVTKVSQAGEIRTVDFVDKLETQGLRPFLYMQHALNRKSLEGYPFYNDEMDAPDFLRMTKEDLPEFVHFEVVGSKGLLGEEERTQRTSMVTAFASGNPLFAPLLNPVALLKEMYQDAGNKNPERFLNLPQGEDPRIVQLQQQAQQAIQQLQARIQELESKQQVEMAKLQAQSQTKQAELQQDSQIEQARLQLETQRAQAELELKRQIAKADLELRHAIAAGKAAQEERIELEKLGIELDGELTQPSTIEKLSMTLSEGSRAGTSELAQAVTVLAQSTSEANRALLSGLQTIADQLTRPKRLVRDANGRPAGVETVGE
jgi:TolA-binding protein